MAIVFVLAKDLIPLLILPKKGLIMTQKLKIYYTSDIHGYVFNTDYLTTQPKNMGLLSVVNDFTKDGNTLILDAGDSIQGSALLKYCRDKSLGMGLLTKVLNSGNYDYFTPGNHDFNYGYKELQDYVAGLNATCILANVIDKNNKIPFTPYTIKTMENGLKVGIVGIVTPFVNVWEPAENIKDFIISDAFDAARDNLALIKDKCDITICVYHGGYEADLATGKIESTSGENQGYRICKELDFDLMLTGHQHMVVPLTNIHGTHTMQISASCTMYGQVEIDITDGVKTFTGINSLPSGNYNKDLYNELLPVEQATQDYLDMPVGTLSEEIPPLPKLDIAVNGSRVADFINQIQLHYAKVDISSTSLGNNIIGMTKEITIRDVMAVLPYPNTIYIIEVTPDIIRQALESCGKYLCYDNGSLSISPEFTQLKVQHYNYDFFAGIEYTFDLTKPVGSRVVRLTKDGKPLDKESYTLAINNYRATGAGGFDFYKDCKVIADLGIDVQELAIKYVEEQVDVQLMEAPDFNCIY